MAKKKNLTMLVKQARKSLALEDETQQDLLRSVRDEFGVTNEELAEALDVSLPTLIAWLAPASAAKHRVLPDEMRRLLTHLLAQTDA